MRTRLFLAFFVVILMAMVSNFIFENLILSDFEEYVTGAEEDRLYWVLASMEGGYVPGEGWNMNSLWNSMHWALMLGFEVEVLDSQDNTLLSSQQVINTLSESMLRRMESIVDLTPPKEEAEPYPLYVAGEEVGTLMVKRLRHVGFLKEKEAIFKRRGRDFLLISFLIAGGGALFLSIVFSLFLSRPVRRLKEAAEAVASGDLSVRVGPGSGDELGKLNRSFDRMVESLEREEALRRHLTSNVAHELRTPLAIMKANLEAVADGVVEPNVQTMDSLTAEVERLINLVKGIEDFTTAEASFFKPAHYEETVIEEFVRDVVQGFHALYIDKGLTLSAEGGEGITAVVDTEKLDIVIRNLLSNALRHTEQGGVTVSMGEAGSDRFFVEVSDTGSGIAPDEMENIFKRFYKGDRSSGVGLGLAIARELVDIMGGRILVKSEKGLGSTFRVEMPLSPS